MDASRQWAFNLLAHGAEHEAGHALRLAMRELSWLTAPASSQFAVRRAKTANHHWIMMKERHGLACICLLRA